MIPTRQPDDTVIDEATGYNIPMFAHRRTYMALSIESSLYAATMIIYRFAGNFHRRRTPACVHDLRREPLNVPLWTTAAKIEYSVRYPLLVALGLVIHITVSLHDNLISHTHVHTIFYDWNHPRLECSVLRNCRLFSSLDHTSRLPLAMQIPEALDVAAILHLTSIAPCARHSDYCSMSSVVADLRIPASLPYSGFIAYVYLSPSVTVFPSLTSKYATRPDPGSTQARRVPVFQPRAPGHCKGAHGTHNDPSAHVATHL